MEKQNMIDAALAFLGNRRQSIPFWPGIPSTLGYMSFFHLFSLAAKDWNRQHTPAPITGHGFGPVVVYNWSQVLL